MLNTGIQLYMGVGLFLGHRGTDYRVIGSGKKGNPDPHPREDPHPTPNSPLATENERGVKVKNKTWRRQRTTGSSSPHAKQNSPPEKPRSQSDRVSTLIT